MSEPFEPEPGEPGRRRAHGAGLVRRDTNAEDARSAYAVITKVGIARFREAAPVYVAAIDEQFAGALTVSELAQVRSLLQRVLDRHDGVLPR